MTFKHTLSILIAILCSSFVVSQSKKELAIKELFWGKNDSQITNTEIPEKWKNESAVILFKEYFYDYHKFAKKVDYVNSFRKRIKLLDKAAVEEYSEFSYTTKLDRGRSWRKKSSKYLGVKIIKPDGTEKEIEVDQEAVQTDEGYKLAISGLEVGDILDYYIYELKSFKQKYGYTFKPITRILSDEYPVKKMVMRFNTENDFFINFNSYNGAPKLQEIETEKRNDRRYFLEAENLEKNEFPFWYYPLKELPYYKFQVVFARKNSHEDDIFNFISENESDIKTKVTQENVLKLYQKHLGREYRKSRFKEVNRYLDAMQLSKAERIKKAYYYYRHFYVTQFIERSVLAEAKIIPDVVFGSTAYDNHFLAVNNLTLIANFLMVNDIAYEYVLAQPRYSGGIEDVLFKSEIEIFLKVNVDGETLYLPPLGIYSIVDNIPYGLENTTAYSLKNNLEKKKFKGQSQINDITKISTPSSSHMDNGTSEKSKVVFSDDLETISIKKNVAYKGHAKTRAFDDLLYYFDYIEEDYNTFGNLPYVEKQVSKKKNKQRITKEANALIQKLKKKQGKYLKEQTEEEYDFTVKNHTFSIISNGRYDSKAPLLLQETFDVENALIKRAGPNYLIELGKLIGGQISLDKDEKARSNHIYMNYPRSFKNTLVIQIPTGYSVKGLDKFNVSVENETGGFVSSTTLVDNTLTVESLKYYKHYNENVNNWGKMTDFLDAAFQFGQEKIILIRTPTK